MDISHSGLSSFAAQLVDLVHVPKSKNSTPRRRSRIDSQMGIVLSSDSRQWHPTTFRCEARGNTSTLVHLFLCTTLSTCVLFFRLLRNVSGQIRHLHACRLLGGRAIRPYVTLFRVCFAVHSHIMTCTCTFSGHSPVRRLSLCTTRTRNGHEFGYKSCLRLSGWFSVSLSIFAERNTS